MTTRSTPRASFRTAQEAKPAAISMSQTSSAWFSPTSKISAPSGRSRLFQYLMIAL